MLVYAQLKVLFYEVLLQAAKVSLTTTQKLLNQRSSLCLKLNRHMNKSYAKQQMTEVYKTNKGILHLVR